MGGAVLSSQPFYLEILAVLLVSRYTDQTHSCPGAVWEEHSDDSMDLRMTDEVPSTSGQEACKDCPSSRCPSPWNDSLLEYIAAGILRNRDDRRLGWTDMVGADYPYPYDGLSLSIFAVGTRPGW